MEGITVQTGRTSCWGPPEGRHKGLAEVVSKKEIRKPPKVLLMEILLGLLKRRRASPMEMGR
jgi:hypothetical protein